MASRSVVMLTRSNVAKPRRAFTERFYRMPHLQPVVLGTSDRIEFSFAKTNENYLELDSLLRDTVLSLFRGKSLIKQLVN